MGLSTSCSTVLVVLVLVKLSHGFDVHGFCKDRCMRGSGGVLCRCNAVHFAGKRTIGTAVNSAPLVSLPIDVPSGGIPRDNGDFIGGSKASRRNARFPPYTISYPNGDVSDTPMELSKPLETGTPTAYRFVNTGFFQKTSPSVFLDNLANGRSYLHSSRHAADNGEEGTTEEEEAEQVDRVLNNSDSPWENLDKAQQLLAKIHRARERIQHQRRAQKSYDQSLPEYLPLLIMDTSLDSNRSPPRDEYEARGEAQVSRLHHVLSQAFGKSMSPLQRTSRSSSKPHHPA